MLQRIQSIFLFFAAGTAFAMAGLPIASSNQAVSNSAFFADKTLTATDHAALLGCFIGAGVLALLSIFLFKNRQSQTRVAIFAFIANFIGLVLTLLFYLQDPAIEANITVNDQIGVYLPFAFMILIILALRFIRKDDKLVKSMDRLR
ncbi:MAG: DUF4293 domain-containing protein [Phaeodactylibacter sp.]|nr:DUF4293 domain-containing protein [Phaeodactylibacter sp.]